MLGEGQHDGRHQIQVLGFVLLDQPEERLKIESRQRHHCLAHREHGVEQHMKSVDVKERQHGDDGFWLVVQVGFALLYVGDEIAVAEHNSFGQPGSAAGIRQHGHMGVQIYLGLARRLGSLGEVFARQELLVQNRPVNLCAAHDHIGDASLRSGSQGGLCEKSMHEDHLSVRVSQLVRQLFGCVERIDGGDSAAHCERAVNCHRILGHIRRHHSQHSALRKPPCLQTAGEASDVALKLPECERLARHGVYHSRLFSKMLGMLKDIRREGYVWNFHGRKRACVDCHLSLPNFE